MAILFAPFTFELVTLSVLASSASLPTSATVLQGLAPEETPPSLTSKVPPPS